MLLAAEMSALVVSVIVPEASTGVGAALACTATLLVRCVPLSSVASVSTVTLISIEAPAAIDSISHTIEEPLADFSTKPVQPGHVADFAYPRNPVHKLPEPIHLIVLNIHEIKTGRRRRQLLQDLLADIVLNERHARERRQAKPDRQHQ